MPPWKIQWIILVLISVSGKSNSEKYVPTGIIHRELLSTDKTDDSPKPNEDFRLSNHVQPKSYRIYLKPNLDQATFKGQVDIDALVNEATDRIELHYGRMEILSQKVEKGGQNISIAKSQYNATTQKLFLLLDHQLQASDQITLSFSYTGALHPDGTGFYNSTYFSDDGKPRRLAVSKFEPTYARYAFPCFDEPALKAKFKLFITVPKDYQAISNMPIKNITDSTESSIVEFEESVPMSSYLVAFMVSDFKSLVNGNIRVWARPNAIDQAQYALKISSSVLNHLQTYFDNHYEVPKMDMVALPDFVSSAMENWGMITYIERALLHDEENTPDRTKQRIATIVAHECTHMWFGNIVSPLWWDYLWLSESFASFFEYMAVAKIEPEFKTRDQFLIDQFQAALLDDSFENASPMSEKVWTQSEIKGKFDTISYEKGASVLRMMDIVMTLQFGPNVFRDSLRRYVKKMKFKAATPEDLWQSFQDEVDSRNFNFSVKEVFDPWTKQSGYPVVDFKVTATDMVISQKKFYLRNLNEKSDNYTWWIPITWISSEKPNKNNSEVNVFWLNNQTVTINHGGEGLDWVLLNWRSAGYYRVNYDTETWNNIIKTLHSSEFEQIPEINRAAIVDDLLNLARAGLVPYNTTLKALKYLSKDSSYLPIVSALNGLDYLLKRFENNENADVFKKYALSLITNVYEDLTYDEDSNDDHLRKLLRQKVINFACRLKYEDCLKKSLEYFEKWQSKGKPIPKNLRSTAYCTVMRQGKASDWEFLWNEFRKSNVDSERITILQALGCSRNDTQIKQLLLHTLTNYGIQYDIRVHDVDDVFNGVYSASLKSAELVISFIYEHHNMFYNYFGNYNLITKILSGIQQNYVSNRIAQQITSLSQTLKAFEDLYKSLNKIVSYVDYEIKWSENNLNEISNYIKDLNELDESKA